MTALVFERLRIQRMPGIRDGGFELDGLAAGLTVVHGPNASGKTTTARAVEALLWPRTAAPADALVTGAFRLGGSAWEVDVAAGAVRFQRDGADTGAPGLPPADGRHRYRLSLHELLAADDAGFAEAIARESAGGYDLAAAARVLDPRRTASRCTRETAALREARARLDEARRVQERLFDDEQRLNGMDRQLRERSALSHRVRLLERAIEHARAAAEAETAARAVDAFDPRIERLRDDDADRLREIGDRLAALAQERRAAAAAREAADAVLERSDLPPGGLPDDLLPSLRQELETLREMERTIAAREQEVRGAETRREAERRALDGVVHEDRLAGLDIRGIGALAEFAHASETLAAARGSLEARLRDLEPGAEPPPAGREVLEHGARLLQQWLRSPTSGTGGERRLRTLGTLAALGFIVAGLALGLVTPLLALVALLGAVLLVLIRRADTAADPRPVHQAEFGRLSLEPPREWSAEGVEACLARLLGDLARARLDEERARGRDDATRQLATLEPRERELAARRAEIIDRLGVDPGTPDGALGWLVERIGRWQAAQAEVDAAGSEAAAARAQLAAGLGRARARVSLVRDEPMPDVPALAGTIADLDGRQQAFRAAGIEQRNAEENLRRIDHDVAECESARRAIFGRLVLDDGDHATVRAWSAELERYRAARERVRLAEACRADDAKRLHEMADDAGDLLVRREDELEQQLEQLRHDTADLDRLRDEATQIRTRIHDAKQAHAVEDALAELDRCEDALRQARERDTRSALGAALLDHVQRATRDQHLPGVFHRARERFARITHGRYRLDFHDGDAPSFRAYDSATGRGHALDELSSATRIQLLMAVRLAFVESQEGEVRLPLLFDETLGNSDDGRAHAIMEAVLEIAAEGRQVFYLTAQPDEVAKWLGLLESRPDVASAVIDLGAARRQAMRLELPGLRLVGAPRQPVPAPAGLSHAGYGDALSVCRLDRFGTADGAHLWYLVEEPDILHRLIDRLRVERWGALRLLVEHGGAALLDPDLFARTEALARALDAALALSRVGRGRPVDRAVLAGCGLISDAFVDALDEICRNCGGDANRLLDALERGEVKRFQTRVRENLQEFLEENGYRDLQPPLEPPAVRARTLAAVAADIDRGTLDVDCVDRLLARVGAALSDPAATVTVTSS